MIRLILSIVGGLLVAFLLVFASDSLFHALVPSAAQVPSDPGDRAAMAAYVAAQPTGVLVGLALGWAAATFVGASIAARFALRGWWPGLVVGGLMLLATAANFAMIPHPTWMMALAIVAICAAAWFGARLFARSQTGSDRVSVEWQA